MLRARTDERAAIGQLLDAARSGAGGGLVLRGGPGIGKSALLADARERASGMRVLDCSAVEAESTLAYAALHQLLRPIVQHYCDLPAPQRQALGIALGLEAGNPPDRFLISLAVLTLLTDVASQQPILCMLDDAQWADEPSLDVIRFVARRVANEPTAFLVAVLEREGRDMDAPGMPVLDLAGLEPEDATAILDEEWGTTPAPAVRAALVRAANGNPLALHEVPRTLSQEERAGLLPLPEPLPLAGDVERVYRAAINRLLPEMKTVALVCAAAGRGSLATIERAAASLGVTTPLLDLPDLERVLHIENGNIDFHHPLVCSAAYHHASPSERRAAHLALADALADDQDQADRRAWHRAAAALGPDEEVASELERSAARTLRRSGHAAAVQVLQRAADLSSTQDARVRRMVAAADAAWHGGDLLRSRGLLQGAEKLGTQDVRVDLHMRFLQGAIEVRSGVPADSFAMLIDAANAAAYVDPPAALRMVAMAGEAGFQAGDMESYRKIGPVLARLPESDDPGQKLMTRLYFSLNSTAPGPAEDPAQLRQDLAAAEQLEDAEILVAVAGLAFGLGEYAAARRLWTRAVANARMLGAAGSLAAALRTLALDEMSRSRYAWAEASAAEGGTLAQETGQLNLACLHAAILAEVTGLRGREQEARRAADDVLTEATERGLRGTVALVRRALGQLALAWGHPEETIEHLEALWALHPNSHRGIALAVIPDMIEGAVRAGRPELAREWLSRLPPIDEGSSAEARALVTRSKALLAEESEADALFQEALRLFATTERALEQARTALLYGEHLRRARRRVAAREHLRAALEAFERLGAVPWAERARSELRASGETARKRDVGSFDQLTRQELQVARLVGQGASNREAAAQLFISQRTVDHHLRSIFQKLAISSRTELVRLSLEQ